MKVATSAWGCTARGDNRFGQTGVWLSTEEVNNLIKQNPDDLVLLSFLFANNGRSKPFMIANRMADRLGWPRKRLAAARKRLNGVYVKRGQGGEQLYRPGALPPEIQGWSKITTYPQLTPLPSLFLSSFLSWAHIQGT